MHFRGCVFVIPRGDSLVLSTITGIKMYTGTNYCKVKRVDIHYKSPVAFT